jgi:hypothetical protein
VAQNNIDAIKFLLTDFDLEWIIFNLMAHNKRIMNIQYIQNMQCTCFGFIGPRMGSSISSFKEHYQTKVKLKNKAMPVYKIFLCHMVVVILNINFIFFSLLKTEKNPIFLLDFQPKVLNI